MSKQTESEVAIRDAIGKSGFGRGWCRLFGNLTDMHQASVEAEVDDGFFLNKAKGSGTHFGMIILEVIWKHWISLFSNFELCTKEDI